MRSSADQVHSLMAAGIMDHTTPQTFVQECFEEQKVASKFPRSQSNVVSVGRANHGGLTSQLTGLKESAVST